MAFRSGTAGYYDLAGDGGTGNLGGFRSGCTSNLVIADGVLNAPDYTRTCTCTYPNQTSLALGPRAATPRCGRSIRMTLESERVTRVGINFGAPGDRRAADGTLWLEHPSVGGASPKVPIEIDPAPSFFCRHSLRFEGEGPAWVGASGLVGGGTIRVRLAPEPGEKPNDPGAAPPNPPCRGTRSACTSPSRTKKLKPGDRVFDVAIDGKPVLESFDVVAQAGGPAERSSRVHRRRDPGHAACHPDAADPAIPRCSAGWRCGRSSATTAGWRTACGGVPVASLQQRHQPYHEGRCDLGGRGKTPPLAWDEP